MGKVEILVITAIWIFVLSIPIFIWNKLTPNNLKGQHMLLRYILFFLFMMYITMIYFMNRI